LRCERRTRSTYRHQWREKSGRRRLSGRAGKPNYWQKAHPGLRRVYFVLDASLWQQFVKLHCATEKPNVVFTRMIREAVQAREGSFESGEP